MPTPTWDKTDQDCNAFDLNWNKVETGSGAVSLVTFDERSCYKYIIPEDGSANFAWVSNTSLGDWTECSAEWIFRVDNKQLGGYSKIVMYIRDKDRYEYNIKLFWDTLWTQKPYFSMWAGVLGTSNFKQWIDLSENEWHTARIIVNSSQDAWYFIDGQFLGKLSLTGGPSGAFTTNTMGVQCYGGEIGYGTRVTYLDHARMSTTKLEPDSSGLITIQGASLNTRYYSEGNEGSLTDANPADQVRYTLENRPSGTAIYALPTVDTGDALASKVRVKIASGVKALQKYPTSF